MRVKLSTEDIVYEKVQAIKQVYHDWGLILRSALKQLSPVDRGVLRSAIRFRVESPKGKKDITGTVSLMVGILDPESPALKYVQYIVKGSAPHFVPIISHGKDTGILDYAKRHGLVYYGKNLKTGKGRSAWRMSGGKSAGRVFGGMYVYQPGNNMFNLVYNQYYNSIQADVQRILRGE